MSKRLVKNGLAGECLGLALLASAYIMQGVNADSVSSDALNNAARGVTIFGILLIVGMLIVTVSTCALVYTIIEKIERKSKA